MRKRVIACDCEESFAFKRSIELYERLLRALDPPDMRLLLRILHLWTFEDITTASAESYIRNILAKHGALSDEWNYFCEEAKGTLFVQC